MEIVTSYYHNMDNVLEQGYIPVCISITTPKWIHMHVEKCELLMPTWRMVDIKYDNARFESVYTEDVLAHITPKNIVDALSERFGDEAKVALLCWEAPSTFCHRHVARKWMNEGGVPVVEFGIENTQFNNLGFGI